MSGAGEAERRVISAAGRHELEEIAVIREGDRARSTLRLVRLDGRIALLKDFSRRGRVFRMSAGALMARREAAAYRRLPGVDGVPRFFGRTSHDGLLIEYLPGVMLARTAGARLSHAFFRELSAILARVRGRGVLHGDIGHNVLVTQDGQPLVVDFGASFVIPRWWALVCTAILKRGALHDERAIAKLKVRAAPHLLTAADLLVLEWRLPFEPGLEVFERLLQRIVRLVIREPLAR